eukprot:32628-Rhodomonas_salina.1
MGYLQTTWKPQTCRSCVRCAGISIRYVSTGHGVARSWVDSAAPVSHGVCQYRTWHGRRTEDDSAM